MLTNQDLHNGTRQLLYKLIIKYMLDENEKNLPEEVHAHCGHDHFKMTHPDTEWESCLDHAQKMGLGTRTYKLVQI